MNTAAFLEQVKRDINVKTLTMPERPQPSDLPFDPERDLTRDQIEVLNGGDPVISEYKWTANLVVNYPLLEKLKDNNEEFDQLKEKIANLSLKENIAFYVRAKLLCPERFHEIDLNPHELLSYEESVINNQKEIPHFSKIFAYKVLKPDYEISDGLWEKKKDRFSKKVYSKLKNM